MNDKQKIEVLTLALTTISTIGGQATDSDLTISTSPIGSVLRGGLYVASRDLANTALNSIMKLTPRLLKLCEINPRHKTAQEIFDLGCGHLLAMEKQSIADNGTCMYKGEGDLCCGAAPFLPFYSKEFEGNDVINLTIIPHEHWGDHLPLIIRLQETHDSPVLFGDREEALKSLASVNKLAYNY